MRAEARGLRGKQPKIMVQGPKAGTAPIPISKVGQKNSFLNSELRTPNSKRLGLFGGTFNPIHLGHLRAGIEIQERFSLDKIIFIPTAVPPHKKTDNLLSFHHRLKMVRLAIAGLPFLQVSDIEYKRKGKSYTIETVRFFKEKVKAKTALFFIVGMDAFLEINTWKDFKDLFALTHFVVMDRPGYRRSHLKEFLRKEVSSEIRFYPQENRFDLPNGFSVYVSSLTLMDISSTRIRALRKEKHSLRYLLPQGVENYILKKDLYAS
jgi:nicotinate-nucleotide adenylyltransferase